jgi:hypothetical protein
MEQLERQVIEKGISDLLSTKHLYQPIRLDFTQAVEFEAKRAYQARTIPMLPSGGNYRSAAEPEISLTDITNQFVEEANYRYWYFGEDKSVRKKIRIAFPPVRTLCTKCGEVEAFNLLGEQLIQVIDIGADGHQVFSFPVQCQRCKVCVIVFLVKRAGPKIQLVGRSEFEEVEVPKFVPKKLSRFYSQAVVAFQCGQVLAGLFLLRTLMEQYMRAVTKSITVRGEDLCEEYAKQLGPELSGRLPSFTKIYNELSNALHTVDDREEVFASQIEQIRLHFEGVDLASRIRAKTKTN